MFSSENKLKNSFVGKKKPNPIFQSLYGGKNLGFEMSLVCHNKRDGNGCGSKCFSLRNTLK